MDLLQIQTKTIVHANNWIFFILNYKLTDEPQENEIIVIRCFIRSGPITTLLEYHNDWLIKDEECLQI